MEVDRKELAHIKEVLKDNPRGMTVTEISKEVRMNRHSVAKYLEMLAVSGHLDMRSFGPSKVYYLSQRLPISAMLSFSSDFIIILDKDLRIVNVNEKFLEFTGLEREDIIHKNIENFSFPLEFEPSIIPGLKEAIDGKESIVEAAFKKKKTVTYFFIKFIPTVFDDADKGVTIIFEDITERKQSERAIRESENKFRSVIEQSLEGIILTDDEGKIIEFNRMGEQITGMKREDMVGKRLWDMGVYLASDNERYIDLLQSLKQYFMAYMKTGRSHLPEKIIELDMKKPDGTDGVLQITYFIIKLDKGHMFCVMMRDITQKKRIEREIVASEAKFRNVIEQTVNGVIIVDIDGRISEFNTAEEGITGYSRKEAIGTYIWDFQFSVAPAEYKDPMLMDKVKRDTMELIKTGSAPFANKFLEMEFVRKDGERRMVNVIVFPIKAANSHILCSINYDITERKKIEREIKDSEEKFRSIIEQSSDGIILSDEKGIVIEYNKGMEVISGISREDCIGKAVWEGGFFRQAVFGKNGKLANHLQGNVQEFLRTGRSGITGRILESEIKRPDGTMRATQIVIFPIKTQKGFKICGIARDITERKRAEDELKKSHIELEQRVKERTKELETANSSLKLEVEQRIRSEEALRDSEAALARAQRVAHIGNWSWNIKRGSIKWSNEAYHIFGYEPGNILQSFDDLIRHVHPEDRDVLMYKVNRYLQSGSSEKYVSDFRIVRADGEIVYTHNEADKLTIDEHDGSEVMFGTIQDVTDIKKAEEALREKEKIYRNLVENISDIVWETNADHQFTYISPQVRDISGYLPEELLGRSPLDMMSKEESERIRKMTKSAFEDIGHILPFELKFVHKDGHDIYFDVSITPILDKNGRIAGYNGISRDITEKKISEEKLLQRTAELQAIFEAFPDLFFRLSADGTILEYHAMQNSLLYVKPEQFTGRKMQDVFPPGVGELIYDAIQRAMSTNSITTIEYVLPVNGTNEDFEGRIVPISSGHLIMIVRNITERKHAENALWESQRFMTMLIRNLPGMIYRCYNDKDWTMDYVSDGCYDLTGYRPADLIMNKTVSYNDLVHPDDREHVHLMVEYGVKESKPFTMEYRIITSSGETRWVREQGCMSEPLESGEKMIEGFITDITERKLAQERMSVLTTFPELNPNPIIELDKTGRISYMNPAASSTFPGLAPGHPVIGGLKTLIRDFENSGLRSIAREIEFDGTIYNQFIYYVPERNMIRIYATDVTEQKRAEEELKLVNRSLRMINDCSQALVRAREETSLLREICRIIVDKGGFRLAWVGFAQHDEHNAIMPIATAGYDEGYVEHINASWDDSDRGNGPTGMAIKTGKPYIVHYSATDPHFKVWREEALKRGYSSMIALPLRINGSIIGNLNIYSTKADAFDATEEKLLMELADDLAYGIMTLRSRAEHKKAEESLQLMKYTIDSYDDSVYWIAPNTTIEYANESACKTLGYTMEELLHMSIKDIDLTFDESSWQAYWDKLKEEKSLKLRTTQRTKNGSIIHVEITSNYINFNGKEYNFAFARALPDEKSESVPKDHKVAQQN